MFSEVSFLTKSYIFWYVRMLPSPKPEAVRHGKFQMNTAQLAARLSTY